MDPARGSTATHSEELLRLLSNAAGAARLYPASSPLRQQAVVRFADAARALTGRSGPVQFHVDRTRFVVAETAVGEGSNQIASLAEALHALQVGRLIIAPGVSEAEVAALLEVLGAEARVVRSSGGVRKALIDAGVSNIAVVEVSLRASSEEGLLGIDLTAAPLDEIGAQVANAARAWEADARAGTQAADQMSEAIGRLETAARDLAMQRCAESLLYLDEETRTSVMAAAMLTDGGGSRMQGMLDAVAKMPPAALARLLRLVAESTGSDPGGVFSMLELPPELAREVAALMSPGPQSEGERGVPEDPDIDNIAKSMEDVGAGDEDHIRLLVADSPLSTAGRALSTTVDLARERRSEDAVRALTEAIAPAAASGAFDEIARAVPLLDELGSEPAVSEAVASARAALADPQILRDAVRRLADDPRMTSARDLLAAAGPAGAEALLTEYLEASDAQRVALLPAASSMLEALTPVASRVLRAGDAESAIATVRLLGAQSQRRTLPALAVALDHVDNRVRKAAVIALAAADGPASAPLLEKALTHWDPETRRVAAREIGKARVVDAVPALLKIIAEVTVFERNYELKKEVITSLEAIHSQEAVPTLQRLAKRPLALGKRNRELRYLARRALESLHDEEGPAAAGRP